MNRKEVVLTVKTIGDKFGRVMAYLCSDEFCAGYKQACRDMVRLFEYAPMDADFECERRALKDYIFELEEENAFLREKNASQTETIAKLLEHVDLSASLKKRVKVR